MTFTLIVSDIHSDKFGAVRQAVARVSVTATLKSDILFQALEITADNQLMNRSDRQHVNAAKGIVRDDR
ncbi:hypothetical protein EDF70_110165 [Neorhizobium sp. JUb45]|nr:hypothetical protein EDF70_110165 [Neorhizobium sp. JUb45]